MVTSRFLLAQSINTKDTVEIARQLSYEKNYPDAVSLLAAYEKSHPDEINSVRLHGQILYWMEDYKTAFELYESYLKNNPDQHYLKLDYGRMLFELEKYDEAKVLVSDYLKTDTANVEAKNMLGTIAYWQGQPKVAISYFQNVLYQYPTNEWALKYMNEINLVTAPYIIIKSGYTDDTQPLSYIYSNLESGWYISSLLFPKIIFQMQNFDDGAEKKNSSFFQIENKFSFPKIIMYSTVSAGLMKSPVKDETKWIGSIELNKGISRYISLSAIAGRIPYFHTLSSLEMTVMQNNYSVSFFYNKSNSWNGNAGYFFQQFDDNNYVQSLYAWLLSPPVNFSIFKIHIGYGFNYSDSKENRFVSIKPLNEIITNYNSNVKITGEYNPYFTPKDQQIHSVLGNIFFSPLESVTFFVNGNIGLYAVAEDPYLFLDENMNNEIIINRDFASKKYFPLEIIGKINYSISQKVSLEADYTYLQTFYFKSNSLNLAFKYTFINE